MKRRKDALTLSKFMTRILGQHNTLTVSRELIELLDHDIPAALLVGQLIYWHDRADDPEHWVYKTYDQWREEIALSEYQVRRATNKLKDKKKYGFVETKLKKINGAPTLHYRIDLDGFSEWILKNLQIRVSTGSENDPEVPQDSLLTETTTENIQRECDPELLQLWAMARGSCGHDELARDLDKLQPVSLEDGVLTLRAPLSAIGRRCRQRIGTLHDRLAEAIPVVLNEVRIVSGD
jgi:hypothetical protein